MGDIRHSVMTGVDLHEPKGVSASAARKVYVADGASSGNWQDQYAEPNGETDDTIPVVATNAYAHAYAESLVVFGELYQANNASATAVAVAGTYYKVLNFTAGESNEITLDAANDKMTVPRDGKYRVDCHMTMQKVSGGGADDLSATFAINGTSQEAKTVITRTVTSTTDKGACGFVGVGDLSANDEITLMVANETATGNILVIDCNVLVQKIGI